MRIFGGGKTGLMVARVKPPAMNPLSIIVERCNTKKQTYCEERNKEKEVHILISVNLEIALQSALSGNYDHLRGILTEGLTHLLVGSLFGNSIGLNGYKEEVYELLLENWINKSMRLVRWPKFGTPTSDRLFHKVI